MTDMQQALLPNGMLDRLPEDAERESVAAAELQSVFAKFGYRLVNPPLLEFEDTLLAEAAGQDLRANTFRIMDPVTQRMMAIRSDTTMQMTRIAASRLNENPRPLRLCYIADVLRVKAGETRPERQFRQAGCELIGSSGPEDTVETALVAIVALDKIGVKNISIDFTAPEILKALCGKNKQREEILAACKRRDVAAFKDFGTVGKNLLALNDISGPFENFRKSKIKTTAEIDKILENLIVCIKKLETALKDYGLTDKVTITIDLLEGTGFEYQSSPSFTLFSKRMPGELGRGGAYTSSFVDKHEAATGFTLYMDTVLRALPLSKTRKAIFASNANWQEVRDLQSAGWLVTKGNAKAGKQEILDMGCNHVYKSGKITKL